VTSADVVVVGAGPAGSTAAYYLAAAGYATVLLEKATLPRDKVCGDGLTPRAVRELVTLGLSTAGWHRNKGLRVYGGGHTLELPWPDVRSFPNYGMARRRTELDADLVAHAVAAGADLRTGHTVTEPLQDGRGRVVGVRAKTPTGPVTLRSAVVIAADGVSSRLATGLGIAKRTDRSMGVAVRTYFATPRHDDEYMESWLELWDGPRGSSNLLPGYGWVFPLGDGSVNVGLGSVSSTARSSGIDYRDLFKRWIVNTPDSWEFTPENQDGPIRGAALPMAFNRKPHYRDGLFLVGDSGGMVSPFNGEGIAYAMQAARYTADSIVQGFARPTAASREAAFEQYPVRLAADVGGYFNLGRVFVRLIEHPEIMRICTRYGLPRPALMKLVMKLLSDVYEPSGGDWADQIVSTFARVAPSA
jgi:geranylgeranyl reductase family protein